MLKRFGGFFGRWPHAFQPGQDASHLAHGQTGHRGFDPFLRPPGHAMLLAVGFLLAMILTGKLPETRQLTRFEARDVLAVPTEQVRRVELQVGEHTITFMRLADHTWVGGQDQEPISGEIREHLDQAIAFMHTARPVRVMHHGEYHSTPLHEFGLEQQRCAVVLSDARRVLLEASFGTDNPQELLQYMQLRGDHDLYLISRFVGQTWEHLGEHLAWIPTIL